MIFECWTDGSCLDNNPAGGPGGFGWVTDYEGLVIEHSCGYEKTTNNRMELMAVINALTSLQERSIVNIYTDSQYTINGATKWIYGWIRNKWKTKNGEDVKNKDLFQTLHKLTLFHKVTFIKVKAHTGIPLNERCDVIAKEAAAHPTKVDEGFIPSSLENKPSVPWFKRNI